MRTLPENDPAVIFAPNTALNRVTYGYPTRPEELVIDKDGKPLRIDRAYSWESPLAAHGLMHMVITNAVNRDPYPIDTLLLFMANMAWNSTMNTGEVREMLVRKDTSGEYAITRRSRARSSPVLLYRRQRSWSSIALTFVSRVLPPLST